MVHQHQLIAFEFAQHIIITVIFETEFILCSPGFFREVSMLGLVFYRVFVGDFRITVQVTDLIATTIDHTRINTLCRQNSTTVVLFWQKNKVVLDRKIDQDSARCHLDSTEVLSLKQYAIV